MCNLCSVAFLYTFTVFILVLEIMHLSYTTLCLPMCIFVLNFCLLQIPKNLVYVFCSLSLSSYECLHAMLNGCENLCTFHSDFYILCLDAVRHSCHIVHFEGNGIIFSV